MEGISERRVARDLANAILKNRISEFEHISVDMLTNKYALTFNEELKLFFIPNAPRGRSPLSLPNMPSDILGALVEREKADNNVVNLPVWVDNDHVIVKDKRHYMVFSISGSTVESVKVENTANNKAKLERQLGRKLSGTTKHVIPRKSALTLYEKYATQEGGVR